MNKNSMPPIQFTELTSDDIAAHKDCYTCLLLEDTKRPLGERGKELHKAMQLFYEEFK